MTDPRQAAIDALGEMLFARYALAHIDFPCGEDTDDEAVALIDYLDAHPEAAAALRAYLPPTPSPSGVHNHGIDPSCAEYIVGSCVLPGDDLGTAWAEAVDLSRPDRTTEGGRP